MPFNMPKPCALLFTSERPAANNGFTVAKDILLRDGWITDIQNHLGSSDLMLRLKTAHFLDGCNNFTPPSGNDPLYVTDQQVQTVIERYCFVDGTRTHYADPNSNFAKFITPLCGHQVYFTRSIQLLKDRMSICDFDDSMQSLPSDQKDFMSQSSSRKRVLTFDSCEMQITVLNEMLDNSSYAVSTATCS